MFELQVLSLLKGEDRVCFVVACSVLSAMLSLHHDEAVCHLAIALVDPLLVLPIPGTHCIHACISYTSDSYVCSFFRFIDYFESIVRRFEDSAQSEI